MKLEILIYCHNFQRRLCFVLSSIHQQDAHGLDVTVNIASLPNNGDPSTESVIKFFSDKLKIKHTLYQESERDEFAYASLTRNCQMKASDTDWFMCHSCDHVLPKNYLQALEKYISGEFKDCQALIGNWGNYAIKDIAEANKTVNDIYLSEGMYINNCYERILHGNELEIIGDGSSLNGRPRIKNIGGHLIFSRKMINERNDGYYIKPEECCDRNLFKHGQRSRSDVALKRKIGRQRISGLPKLIHLNHNRDKDFHRHLEEQR